MLLPCVVVVWCFVLQIICVFPKHRPFHRQQTAAVSMPLCQKIDIFSQMLPIPCIQIVAAQQVMCVHRIVRRALVIIVQIGGHCFLLYQWGSAFPMSIQSILMPWRFVCFYITKILGHCLCRLLPSHSFSVNCCLVFLIMVALCNRADHYIFALWFLSFFFPRLISAVAAWMSTILPHMVWP